ncbi:hypothetical protein [Lysinibacillus xylanilyticus]|uniref:hypothetical protein n=1 Tax=Lysinibacillus xylanilyticus TaxID=582475 RepID=UPI003CFF5E92
MLLESEYGYLYEEVENINYLLSLNMELPAGYIEDVSRTISTFNKLSKNNNDFLDKTLLNNMMEVEYSYLIDEQGNSLIDIYNKEIKASTLDVEYINSLYNKMILKRNKYIQQQLYKDYFTYYKERNNNNILDKLFNSKVNRVIPNYIKELKSFYINFEINEKDMLHPFKLNNIRINNQKYKVNFKEDFLENIKIMDSVFGKYLERIYDEGFILIKESNLQEGFFIELPYTKKGFIYSGCIGDIDDYFNTIHEIGHLYHQYITSNVEYKNRCNSLEIKEFVAHSFEALFVRQFSSEKVKKIYEIQQISSVLWNVVLFEFQKIIYRNPNDYLFLEEKERVFVDLLKKYTHSYLYNTNEYDILLGSTWMYESMLFETPFYNCEYIYAQINAVDILNNHQRSLEEIKNNFKNGKNINIKSLEQVL